MKTQKFLKVVRLMTFTALLGIVSLTASAMTIHDENISAKTGGVENNMKESNEQPELEQWMISRDYWRVEVSSNMLETIVLEDWMTDRFEFQTIEQQEMDQVKSWMLDEEYFETREQRNLNVIEDWMLKQSYWKI